MPKEKDPEEMLNATEAGKLLGISGKTVVRLMEEGRFRGYKIGNVWKYRRGDIEAYREASVYRPGSSGQDDDDQSDNGRKKLDPAA